MLHHPKVLTNIFTTSKIIINVMVERYIFTLLFKNLASWGAWIAQLVVSYHRIKKIIGLTKEHSMSIEHLLGYSACLTNSFPLWINEWGTTAQMSLEFRRNQLPWMWDGENRRYVWGTWKVMGSYGNLEYRMASRNPGIKI